MCLHVYGDIVYKCRSLRAHRDALEEATEEMNWCCIEYSVLERKELPTHEETRRNLKCTGQWEEANQKKENTP